MKAAVAMGNQTFTVKVSGGAMSISSREKRKEASGAKGGVSLFLECDPFYVVRKHTTVRHNKWRDGAISEALLMAKEAQRSGSL